jgi:hypothetical protein
MPLRKYGALKEDAEKSALMRVAYGNALCNNQQPQCVAVPLRKLQRYAQLSLPGSKIRSSKKIENTQLILISFMDKYAVNITIPDGYTVEQVPEPLNVSIENVTLNIRQCFKYYSIHCN